MSQELYPSSGDPLTDAELRATAVPVSISGTVTVSASNFDIRDLVYTSDSVTAHQGGSWIVGVSGSVAVTGTFWQATQPVSASALPLPTGAATEAKQPAFGTAGTPSADVVSVQGVSGGEPIEVTGTLTASGGLTDAELRATAVPVSIAAPVTVVNLGTFGVQADTELPAASSLADATGNPTAPAVGAFLSGWNGSSWDRVKTVNTGQIKATLYDTSGTAILPSPAALSDTASNPTTVLLGSCENHWDPTNSQWQRKQAHDSRNLIASASYNPGAGSPTASATQTNRTGKYCLAQCYVSSAGTGTLTFRLLGRAGGSFYEVLAQLTISGTGLKTINYGPGCVGQGTGATVSANVGYVGGVLPREWYVDVVHSAASAWTYRVDVDTV